MISCHFTALFHLGMIKVTNDHVDHKPMAFSSDTRATCGVDPLWSSNISIKLGTKIISSHVERIFIFTRAYFMNLSLKHLFYLYFY